MTPAPLNTLRDWGIILLTSVAIISAIAGMVLMLIFFIFALA